MTLQRNHLGINLEPLDVRRAGVHPLISQRHSQADFSPEALDPHQIVPLLQAARCAPSSHNSQPWYFVVVTKGPGREAIDRSLTDCGAPWAVEAPVLIGVIVDQQQGTRQNGLNYALFDTGLAVQNMLLQATSMGLSAHPVNYYDPELVQDVLSLPQTHELVLFIAVGWPSDEIVTTEATPLRRPLAEIAAWDCWGGEMIKEK